MNDTKHAELRAIRPALYHRFHALLPLFASPLARSAWRVAGWLLFAAYLAFAALILTLRYSVLPNIEQYRGRLEQLATTGLGLPVRIGSIHAAWKGLSPDLTLSDVRVDDAEGRPALAFSRVEAILDWSSLVRSKLVLSLLAIDEPVLHIRRDAKGGFTVAGIPVSTETQDTAVAEWVLAQRRLRVNGATLVWEDEVRGAPPLILEDVGFALDNDGSRHRFGLTALPPPELAARIDIRGDLSGNDVARFDGWKGRLFAELDYVDLAGWQQWVDYPVALPKGRGAMRAWLTVGEGRLADLVADVGLDSVRLKLAHALPELRLSSLSGRLAGRLRAGGFAASARGLNATLEDGTQIPSTDFSVDWQSAADGRSLQGSATASRLSLQRINALSRYLPLDAATRKLLDDYAPSGEIADLRLSFSGNEDALTTYSLRTRFSGLGLRAQGYFPGFFGLSGTLEASDKGGVIALRSEASGLELPSVFPEPTMNFDSLGAQVKWKLDGGRVDVDLQKVEFAGHDAAGSARGTYVFTGDGPGTIDLSAALTRARGDAVWRYMPHAVNAEARSWLRRGITAGNASDAKLTLKGNLANFPFLDGSGTFLVTAKAHDVTLDYAPGWPQLEGIDGDLRFAGAGMRVDARRGSIMGTQISATVAEIPDFDADNPLLTVHGKVDGAVADFFRFIEASPVGASLEHATSDMSGVGKGSLDLSLHIPLATVDDTRIQGDFRFLDSQVTVDPVLPPLTSVKGSLRFTDGSISIRDITGQFLGGPVKVRAETRGGVVDVAASGTLSVAQARRQYDLPLFDRLSGSTTWKAAVKVKKSSASVIVDTDLGGISSSLPAPFNKTATDTLPVRFEKALLPADAATKKGLERDRIQVAVGPQGKVAAAQLIRQRETGGRWVPERGALGVGVAPLLPVRGMAVAVELPEIDLDFWRSTLQTPGGAAPAAEMRMLLPDQVHLRSKVLGVFGRVLNDVDLRARLFDGSWQASIVSRETTGDIAYNPFARGAIKARLKTLAAEAQARGTIGAAAAPQVVDDLPALDIVADSFAIGDKKLGRLELQAVNEAASWRIDRLSIVNTDGRLEGSGVWRMQSPRRFSLDFSLAAGDVGNLLGRLGYPGTVRRGTANLSGKLNWAGSPVQIDYPSLSGSLQLEAEKGQFAKLDPGAAGKLLGLISLQGLPRRITLDFNDVFSEGFAFDSINGRMEVKSGVMRTERFQIDGPSARVLMRGDVDLENETQKLVVSIQPELGGTAALGIAIVNPIAGAATLLAHKVLQNPLNQVFSFDYSITGKWDDPKVDKLSKPRLGLSLGGDGEGKDGKQQ